ncbi:MAG: hypothetical protein IJU07_01665, partial [Synergistaceae bacterium]|nr:hypothetical protein [Synergistaceae bacterium]
GTPVKIVSEHDLDYTAILQAVPYHVDNLTADGKSLAKQPRNFTLRLDTAVTYNNTSTSSDRSNLTYGMTKRAETIYALDSDFTRKASKTFQGVRGITSALIGSTDVGKKIDLVGKVWDKLKDTVDTTTSKSNEYSQSYTMSITAQSNYYDTLYANSSKRYIWRYPVLTYPAPDWLIGQVKDSGGSFDKSQVNDERLYITFAMSEPNVPTAAIGINDSYYQPYHEIGNLFSYPSNLNQIEGYKDGTYMANNRYREDNPIEWRGANFEESIIFTREVTSQDSTVKVNKAGAVTKFLSAIDMLFGSDLAHIPHDSSSSFTRTVTNQEGLSIKIPEAFSNARFYMRFAPFLDVTGAMNVGFAVNYFERDDALWGEDSLYSKRPDPSLLLPEKFNHVEKSGTDMDRAVFEGNDNDPTAMKARGIRYILADYDINTDNLLLNGMRYKIRVPVYNASFVDADNFKVRLSYAKTNKYNTERTKIGDYTFAKLPGWSSGNNRQYAEFEWTPDVKDGLYYLFVDIDPENKIKEVHENRRDKNGKITDYGGNNMGFFRIGVSTTENLVFDRSKLQTSSSGEIESAEYDELPNISASASGDLTIEDLIRERVESKAGIVPFEINLTNDGDSVMPNLTLIGYKLKPESKGKDISELSDEDIGLIFLRANNHVFPGEDNTVHFRINPDYLDDGIGFLVQINGEEYALTDVVYRSEGSSGSDGGVSGASSGGCGTGFSGLAGLAVIGILMLMRRK